MSLRPHSRTVLARLGQALGLLLAMGTLHADQAAFEKANTLYKDGKHAEAAEAYQELSQTGVSANLLFNMGNAYFKAGELGRALAAYQRALHLAPRHPDIMVNLRIAQRKALTEPLPLSLRQQWLRKLSLGEWTALASFCGTLFLILLTVRQVWPASGASNILWTRLSAVAAAVATMLLVMAVMFFLGFFLDFIEIIFVVVPIVGPVLIALGYDPLWLGVMIGVNLQTSFLTPPFGFALFYLRGVAPPSVKTRDIYIGVAPFIGSQILALALFWYFPAIVTWLPKAIFG